MIMKELTQAQKSDVKAIALDSGFTLKHETPEGLDLKPYVYDFACNLLNNSYAVIPIGEPEVSFKVHPKGLEILEARLDPNGEDGLSYNPVAVINFKDIKALNNFINSLQTVRQGLINGDFEPLEGY